MLHVMELPWKLWTHISNDCITDLLESSGCTTILVVVDKFPKRAHFVPL
jgi:hypothetical protein